MIRRIDQEVLDVVGLPDKLQRLLDAVGKRRMIVLLVDGDDVGSFVPANPANPEHDEGGQRSGEDPAAKTNELLHRELESRYFQAWDLDQAVTVVEGDRVWIACDVHEWAFKSRASRLLHEVNRRADSLRRSRRR